MKKEDAEMAVGLLMEIKEIESELMECENYWANHSIIISSNKSEYDDYVTKRVYELKERLKMLNEALEEL